MDSATGLRIRSIGAAFERMIDSACEHYERIGVAKVEKTPEPMRVLRPYGRGQFIACFTKSAQPDYKGCLSDGTCIVFDAKYTEREQIAMTRVTPEQAANLDAHEHLNAKCYIVVGMGAQSAYRVPWDVWKNMKTMFGHKHMKKSELEAFRVPVRNGRVLYLEGL